MWIKIGAAVLLGGTLFLGAALVSKAQKPGEVQGLSGGAIAQGSPVETISTGERVDFADHVDPAWDTTVFEFMADW